MGQSPGRVISQGSVERVLRVSGCESLSSAGVSEIIEIEAVPPYSGGALERNVFLAILCHAGELRALINGRPFDVPAGSVLFVHRGSEVEITDNGRDFRAWAICYSRFPTGWARENMLHVSIHAQSLANLLSSVYTEHFGDGDVAVITLILEIINSKIRRAMNPHQTHSRLQPVWARVSQEPAQEWTNESLARIISVSTEHLRRLCHAELGCAPMERVRWIRIHEAAQRLRGSNDTISYVAEQVGYQSERAFRSAFEEILGSAPSAYRRQERPLLVTARSAPARMPVPVAKSESYAAASACPRSRWMHVPLGRWANSRFSQGERPWFGDLPLMGLRAGTVTLHGARFRILPETQGPSFVLFRSDRLGNDPSGQPLPTEIRVGIQRRVHHVYVLHAAGWVDSPGPFARYEFVLSDGSAHTESIYGLAFAHPDEADGRPANIQDWYFGHQQIARPAARHANITPADHVGEMAQYLYTMEWRNPEPSRALRSIRIVSDPRSSSTLGLLAVSLILGGGAVDP